MSGRSSIIQNLVTCGRGTAQVRSRHPFNWPCVLISSIGLPFSCLFYFCDVLIFFLLNFLNFWIYLLFLFRDFAACMATRHSPVLLAAGLMARLTTPTMSSSHTSATLLKVARWHCFDICSWRGRSSTKSLKSNNNTSLICSWRFFPTLFLFFLQNEMYRRSSNFFLRYFLQYFQDPPIFPPSLDSFCSIQILEHN